MKRVWCYWLTGWTAIAALLCGAAPPKEADVQGLYEGTCTGPAGTETLQARVVALGGNAYKMLLRRTGKAGATVRTELDAKADGDTVSFTGSVDGAQWTARYAAGTITGTCGAACKLELKRAKRQPPTLGKKPPEGAVVLLDGKNFGEMNRRSADLSWHTGDMSQDGWGVWETRIRTVRPTRPDTYPTKDNVIPEGWTLLNELRRVDTVLGVPEDGSVQVPKQGMMSRRSFEGSFDLHVEFLCPLRPDKRSQGRGNSGVFFPCRTEIQVLDSFGMPTYKGGGCGGLYRWKDPDTMELIESLRASKENLFNLSSLPPLEWQTYDIEYRVRKDEKGKPAAYLTAHHNGIKIHDDVKLPRPPRRGQISFQDHGNPVRYRNIWILPLERK